MVHIMDPASGYVTMPYNEAVSNWTHSIITESITKDDSNSAITYMDDGKQRIYSFENRNDSLYVNYWDGNNWHWANQGTPIGITFSWMPATVRYMQHHTNRIYSFIVGSDSYLYVNYWDGNRWNWSKQGIYSANAKLYGKPSVIAFKEGIKASEKIYTFAVGKNSRLYSNYWNGQKWRWIDLGSPQGRKVYLNPSTVTYKTFDVQRIYTFVPTDNGHMYVNYFDGSNWIWSDQGTPPGSKAVGAPSAVSFKEGDSPRMYAFSGGLNGRLYVRYWNGNNWNWADQGNPAPGVKIIGSPSVITYRDNDIQKIYAFIRGSNGRLYVNYWDGNNWYWSDRGKPSGILSESPRAVTYREDGKRKIYVFLNTTDKKLHVHYWNGDAWSWAYQGKP